ncbi:MAG: GNAT family N-acetyltransferase [Clostridia bacterium]|nr:GNAT family N-acetyltransferase [Clostridia bacterium]
MEIYTQRLKIRNLQITDWKALKAIWRDNSLSKYAQYDVPHSEDDDDIKTLTEKFSRTNDFYVVMLAATDTVIGCVDLHNTGDGYDIGYCFISQFHRNGYAKESCNALIEFYCKNGVRRFTAGSALKNIPSVSLLLSLGFRQTGTESISFYQDENGNDIVFEGGIYELIK